MSMWVASAVMWISAFVLGVIVGPLVRAVFGFICPPWSTPGNPRVRVIRFTNRACLAASDSTAKLCQPGFGGYTPSWGRLSEVACVECLRRRELGNGSRLGSAAASVQAFADALSPLASAAHQAGLTFDGEDFLVDVVPYEDCTCLARGRTQRLCEPDRPGMYANIPGRLSEVTCQDCLEIRIERGLTREMLNVDELVYKAKKKPKLDFTKPKRSIRLLEDD